MPLDNKPSLNYNSIKLKEVEDIPQWWFETAGESRVNFNILQNAMQLYLKLGLTTYPFFKTYESLYILVDGEVPYHIRNILTPINRCLLKWLNIEDVRDMVDYSEMEYLKWINYESLSRIFENRDDMDYTVSSLFNNDRDDMFCDRIEHECQDRIKDIREICILREI